MESHDRINLLLVDDHVENLLALESILASPELNIVKASSGREALRFLLRESFALILMDVQMPDLNGIQTAELIRQNSRTRHIPIIFLTAHGDMKTRVFEGYHVGAVDYLFKPIEPLIMRAKVGVFVELHRKTIDLQRQQEALEIANRELEEFAHSVSHDLRAPLRHLSGFIEMLVQHASESLDDKSKRYLKIISVAVEGMGTLIDDLLALSRTANHELAMSRVNLDQFVRETIVDLPEEISHRAIEWRIDPLPEVTADPVLLRQVLINYLTNALKFTRTRERALIHIGTETRAGQIVVFVRDNGVGFEPTLASKLFVVFQRLHSKDQFEGNGIGLANVRRIIERHGGRVWAEGKVGEGATFWFSLPNRQEGMVNKQ